MAGKVIIRLTKYWLQKGRLDSLAVKSHLCVMLCCAEHRHATRVQA